MVRPLQASGANMLFSLSGTEFAVNTSVAGVQRYSDIAALKSASGTADGFVAVWQDGDNAIRAQRLTASGATTGPEVLVNTPDDAILQGKPAVAALDGGGFVVVWNNYLTGIVAQRFDAAGAKVGEDLRITASDEFYQDKPAVTAVAGGGFAVAWEGKTSTGGVANVFSQLVGSDGAKIGGEVALSASSAGFGAFNATAAKFGAGYVSVWQDNSEAVSKIVAQAFDASGAKSGVSFTVATAGNFVGSPTAVAPKNGGYVVAWASSDAAGTFGISAQVYSSDGKASGDKVAVAASNTNFASLPDITALADGGFAVSWQVMDYAVMNTDVFARSFGATGTPAGDAFKLNTVTAGEQTYAEIAAGVDGKLAAVWTGQNGGDFDIKGQAFSSDFTPPAASLTLAGDFAATVAFKGNYKLTAADLGTANADGSVVYTVSGAKNGFVSLTSNITAIKTFTQADLAAGKVVFVQSGTAKDASFNVSAKDADETTGAKTFKVVVTNQAPKDIRYVAPDGGATALRYYEESETGWGLRVTDPESESGDITWSIVGGADKNAFTIGNGRLAGLLDLKKPEDFEKPTDANKDHKFEIVVRATDKLGAYTDQALTVTVENALEFEIAEGAAKGAVVAKGVTPISIPGLPNELDQLIDLFFGARLPPGETRFSIDKKSGNLLVNEGFKLDFEQDAFPSFRITRGFLGGTGETTAGQRFLIKLKDVTNEYVSGNDRDNILKGGAGDDTFFGNGAGDMLVGGDGLNLLDGGAGDDILVGGKDADTYRVDSRGDTVNENLGGGEDTIEASISYSLVEQAGKEKITGFVENLTLLDDSDARTATGNDLKNELTGNKYGNTLDGGKKADTMQGLGGDDTYKVDDKGDRVDESVRGSGGRDSVISTVSFDLTDKAQARGEIETVFLDGDRKSLDATGDSFANLIFGNFGDNKITGGGGADKLSGGPGANPKISNGRDTFIFEAVTDSGLTQATRDQILDFGEGDQIDLSRINPEGRKTFILDTGGAFVSGEIRQTLNGGNKSLLIEINTDADGAPEMSILLANTTAKLDADDFIL